MASSIFPERDMMERAGVPAAMFNRPEFLPSEANETGSRDGHLV